MNIKFFALILPIFFLCTSCMQSFDNAKEYIRDVGDAKYYERDEVINRCIKWKESDGENRMGWDKKKASEHCKKCIGEKFGDEDRMKHVYTIYRTCLKEGE